jgi:hypothetical protein
VNQVALRRPPLRDPAMVGLGYLEYQYFEARAVELCVTPVAAQEIAKGLPVSSLGQTAYNRIQKCELFKARPASTTLALTAAEANHLWMDITAQLWRSIPSAELTPQQVGDVGQLFFHVVCNSGIAHSTFVTMDGNFLTHAPDLRARYGVEIADPNEAWREAQRRYGFPTPTPIQVDSVWQVADEWLRSQTR